MRIKYMGTSDVRIIPVGDTFGGRYRAEVDEGETPGIQQELRWDWDNHHIINTDKDPFKKVPKEVWDLVLKDPEMLDVTKEEVIPLGGAQRMWKGMQEEEIFVPVSEDETKTASSAKSPKSSAAN